jgi:hypothetical protein
MRLADERWNRTAWLAMTLTVLGAAPALAGVNRWTTHWPSETPVNQLAIDPVNPDVVYVATPSGVLTTGNGGLSWSDPSSGALEGVQVHCLAIDPERPVNVYAGTSSGIFASSAAGASWTNRATAHGIYNIVFGSQHTVYAAELDDSNYYYPGPSPLHRSTDDGKTWSTVALPFVILPRTLAVDPANPSNLYAGTWTGGWGNPGVMSKSVDGGSTWSTASDHGGNCFAFDPQNPATIYSGDYGGIYKSIDSGATWNLVSGSRFANDYVGALVIDQRHPSTIYAASWSGIFRSTDGGTSWSDFNTGLVNPSFGALAIDRTGTRLHAAGNGVFDYQIVSGALDVSVSRDNTTRVIFLPSDEHLLFRTEDGSGNSGNAGPYGPYSGWSPKAVAEGSDGLTRVLWNHLDGSAALWLVGAGGNPAAYRLGPVQGWTAVDVASATAGTSHILWTHADGRVGFWAVDNSGHVSYGPKLTPDPGWTAVAIADGADGLTRLLWNKLDGSAGLSFVGSGGLLSDYRFSGAAGWRAADVAVGPDGQSRILWTCSDGRMALYRVDDSGNITTRGPVYDGPAGFTAQRIAAAPDGAMHVLWTDADGAAVLWRMSADNVYQQSFPVTAD